MPETGSPTEVKADTARAVAVAKIKILLAFVVLPVLFCAALLFLIYVATHWPYPPGFEWVSRWTPKELFYAAVAVLGTFLVLFLVFVWRLAARWLWEPAARVLAIIEGAEAGKGRPEAAAPGDSSRLFYRIERAAERHRSASEGAAQLDAMRGAVARLCDEIEQVGLRRFDRDFSSARGPLEPIGKSLEECCKGLSDYMSGCAEVVEQIKATLLKAQEQSASLAAQAESAFVGQSELSVQAKDFTRRVQEALSAARQEAGEEGRGGDRGAADAAKGMYAAAEECAGPFERLSGEHEGAMEISEDSKKLADEATVIALNSAIEASRSGSADLEGLAEAARKLAEGCMELSQRIESLSTSHVEGAREAAAALDGLKSKLSAWLQERQAEGPRRAEAAAGLEELLVSVNDMAASLAGSVESVAGLSEASSSEAQAARRAIDQTLSEMESLKRRLAGGNT